MLQYVLVYFIVALVVAVIGLGSPTIAVAAITKTLFVLFLVMAIVSLCIYLGGRR